MPVQPAGKIFDQLLGKLKAQGIEILLTGMEAPRNWGADYDDRFRGIYPPLAQKYGTVFYPFFLKDVATIRQLNQPDGLHPTAEGVAIIAGVDEVGRGCWAGPVYAAAAILPDGLKHRHLNDSKILMAEYRDELNHFLCSHPEVRWSIGIASTDEIETHNILGASLLAMRRAVEGLAVTPHLCISELLPISPLPPKPLQRDGSRRCRGCGSSMSGRSSRSAS